MLVHHSGLSSSHIDTRDQPWAAPERPRTQSNPREGQDPHLSPAGRAPTLQHPPHQSPLRPSSGPRDCRHSPHGCCPDGHTPSLGPQWQGCPLAGASCLQSRWVETALPPQQGRKGKWSWAMVGGPASLQRASVPPQGKLDHFRSEFLGCPGCAFFSCVWRGDSFSS